MTHKWACILRRRFFGLLPVVVGLGILKLFFDFDEKFLSMWADLCSISGSNKRLDFFPIFAIEL